ncbi:MAG TPA: cytochrome c oxidase subunit 3 family protein [Nitrospirota bacterium]|nr:cytochrome c oxidase subunit 3 family protein [Nitrospirota bacterium]
MNHRSEATLSEHKDYTGAKLGMWLFLFTEILLFGGMFLLYAVYREVNTSEFHEAGLEMSKTIGAVNTIILLTSSLTMALSISAIKNGLKNRSILFQAVTVILGVVFLVNKYVEWSDHIRHGLYPDSPELLAMGHGKVLFFGLYYVMTGIHGLHVLIGMCVIGFTLVLTLRDNISRGDYIKLENAGLFWHLVDVIWIYLFPLFYLII